MLKNGSCSDLFLKKLNKTVNQLTVLENHILYCVVADNSLGRYSKFLMWNREDRNAFLSWLEQLHVDYMTLSDAERWAYEDAFCM